MSPTPTVPPVSFIGGTLEDHPLDVIAPAAAALASTTPLEAPVDEPELVVLSCDLCDWQTPPAPSRGKGSAPWRLGTHRANKHGIKGGKAKTGARGAKEPTPDELADRPAVSILKSAAAAVDGKTAPTELALAKGLGRGMFLVNVMLSTVATETDPRIPRVAAEQGVDPERIRSGMADELTLPEKTWETALRPLAKLAAPTKLNAKYGRTVVDNVDVLAVAFDLFKFGQVWTTYFRDRRTYAAAVRGQAAAPAVAAYTPPPVSVDTDTGAGYGYSEGRILTADDVAAMRARTA